MKTRFACCEICRHVVEYQEFDSGDTDFPRGEWLVHRDSITTGFRTAEAAQEWLDAHPA